MSYTVLARKYRSGDFDEVVGQDHVAKTLKKAISSGRVAHAFLFCGTRGVGKTSMARILAKALNCRSSDEPVGNPCGKCPSCLAIARGDDMDVIEIDAASNTQVEKTREIIDNARYMPAQSRFKVYIIDEVHMLSKASFNALLKTLEEPPEHVKFILATTEPEKVLPTILSRCQRYDFRNISSREIAQHLQKICKDEKVKADDDALLLIARAGAGSMRDALSLLDRLLSAGETALSVATIEQMLGMPPAQVIHELVQAIGEADAKRTLRQVDAQLRAGMSADTLVVGLIEHLRNLLVLCTCGPDEELIDVPGIGMEELGAQAQRFDPATLSQDIAILEELRHALRSSSAGRALLDATLVRLALAAQFTPIAQLSGRIADSATTSPDAPALKKNADPSPRLVDSNVGPVSCDDLDVIRRTLLQALGPRDGALLDSTQLVEIDNDTAVLRFPPGYDSVVTRLMGNGKRNAIGETLAKIVGRPVNVKFESALAPVEETKPSPAPRRSAGVRHSAQPPREPVSQRITPELKAELRRDPVVSAVMDELAGEPVRVE